MKPYKRFSCIIENHFENVAVFCKAKNKYVELALQIKDYQEKKHENWLRRTESELPLLMKQTLLITSEAQKVLQAVLFSTDEMSRPVMIRQHIHEVSYICFLLQF